MYLFYKKDNKSSKGFRPYFINDEKIKNSLWFEAYFHFWFPTIHYYH